MNSEYISGIDVFLLCIPLPQPFRLGFGELFTLPRVILRFKIEGRYGEYFSYGEAAIDFPFSAYDAWDNICALRSLTIIGSKVEGREKILEAAWKDRQKDFCYAAQAALNMALDGAYAQSQEKTVAAMYGSSVRSGQILQSVGMSTNINVIQDEIKKICLGGRIPKIKCDADIASSTKTLKVVAEICQKNNRGFLADFNASLNEDAWNDLLRGIANDRVVRDMWKYAEQPTLTELGIEGLIRANITSKEFFPGLEIIADETLLDEADAERCGAHEIILNLKLQKVGGIDRARKLLETAQKHAGKNYRVKATVGGTFPTALGRVYDQNGAAILASSDMPSDGWQPATDWFTGPLHLIHEAFCLDQGGSAILMKGKGSGFSVDEEKMNALVIPVPEEEYRKIRTNGKGNYITIRLKDESAYREKYEILTGKKFDWNL
ncbi:MAG: hypothetical protein A3F54_01770 [Candidatus Kerfeldbacteria bacterium RIFCSPHIGHO2_12_FULL_48_17]|uniref:Enolase C-terminal domain-containing protein n=1 Tax=Candidatus Kerfeldbacteria bacterium RIFCSPHIGHO2_12_FULL_48_17 TaxID=1798542 RepID=A0A1G2AYR7_9BACT|nr:MAG: hypothetical protein A3F54_01770 [Candidatus Kerfeldbacteria bacterium RIFCSPHIGHO2_12_FULL_48_17]